MIGEEIVEAHYCYECGSRRVWVMDTGEEKHYKCDNCGETWTIKPTGNVAEDY